jgi:beta-lactam-binding protein with PASTA domain
MPDLTGLSLRDAMRMTNRLQIHLTAEGDGSVIGQAPPAGTVVEPGMAGVLRLRRQPADRSDRR